MNGILTIKITILTLLIMVAFKPILRGQDIEKVLHSDSIARSYVNELLAKDPLVFSGNLSLRVDYNTRTPEQPTSYLLNGSIMTDVFGYQVPLSFSFTNRNFNYQLRSPIRFNRIRFNPKYKWVKLYLGQSAMSFSPYTLSGIMFTGVGVELTPKGPFKFSAMKGRIFDAVPFNSNDTRIVPVYQRDAYAFKAVYSKSKVFIEASFFDGYDKNNSLTLPTDTFIQVAPLRNVAYSLKSKISPFEAVSLEMEYAASAINFSRKFRKRSISEMLWENNTGVSHYSAYKVTVNFSPGKFNSGISIEHIDPDFTTLGAYYCRSDFQNITLNVSTSLLKGKVTLSANGGVENDNLKNQKQKGNTRTVGACNLMYRPTKKITFSANYSNFQSFSNIKNQFDYINNANPYQMVDTIKYLQVNQNMAVNFNYQLTKTDNLLQSLALVGNLNQANSSVGNQNNAVNYYNLNSKWTLVNKATKIALNAGFNSSFNLSDISNRTMLGPVLSAKKQFFEKITGGFTMAYNITYLNSELNAQNTNIRISCAYVFKEIHNFSVDLFYLKQKFIEKQTRSSVNISVTYSLKMNQLKLFKPIKPLPEPNKL